MVCFAASDCPWRSLANCQSQIAWTGAYGEVDPRTFEPVANRQNDYLIDREKQHSENFTGMRGIRDKDIAIQENLYGPMVDRTKEHLGISDGGVIALRHRLLKMARDRQAGQKPSEPHCGGAYRVHPTASLVRRGISFNEVARSAMPIRLDA